MTWFQNLHSILPMLFRVIKYHGSDMFRLSSIKKHKKIWLEKLIYNNKVWFHLKNYTMKFNTNLKCNMMIWNSYTHKVSPLSPKVYSNDCLLSNTNPTHFKEGIDLKFTLHFLLLNISKVGWLFFWGKFFFSQLWFRLILIANGCLKSIINYKRNLLVRQQKKGPNLVVESMV